MTQALPRDDRRSHLVTDAVRRHWLVILIVTLVVGAIVGAFAFTRKQSYESTAVVLLRPLTGNALSPTTAANSQSTTVAMETEANLVNSLAVTKKVNKRLGTKLQPGGSHLTVTVPVNSQVLRISCTASSSRKAQRCAQAYGQLFLTQRAATAKSAQNALIEKLTAQANEVEGELAKATREANQKNPPSDASTKVRLYTSSLSSTLSQLGQAQSVSTDPGSIVTPAPRPSGPSGLSPALLTGAAVVAGIVLGIATALWRERIDDRIRASAESEILTVPVLAVLPSAGTKGRSNAGTDSTHNDAVRRARTSLLAAAKHGAVIAVTGLTVGDNSTDVAADLARSLAVAGYQVTLVDATIHAASAPVPLMGVHKHGLAEILSDGDSSNLVPELVDGVRVVPAGEDPMRVRELYSGRTLREVIEQLQRESDYVLVATSPASSADGMTVMLAVDSALLIVSDRHATHEQIALTQESLARLGVGTLGLVIRRTNKTPTEPPANMGAYQSDSRISSPGIDQPRTASELADRAGEVTESHADPRSSTGTT